MKKVIAILFAVGLVLAMSATAVSANSWSKSKVTVQSQFGQINQKNIAFNAGNTAVGIGYGGCFLSDGIGAANSGTIQSNYADLDQNQVAL